MDGLGRLTCTLKLTVAYDGTRFRGWARQPGERSVESTLAEALASLYSLGAGRSRSPAAPTPACTRSRTSSRSTSRAGRRSTGRPRR